MLFFKKKFLPAILSGEKTQTIRVWPHRKMRAGQRSYIPGAGYIQVEAVDAVALSDLTADDARRDGFVSLTELRQEIAGLYASEEHQHWQSFRIRFRLLTPAEQAAAIVERES